MKIGKCKLCGEIRPLQKHHYIPQRIKKMDHWVYICGDCHNKVHPENKIIVVQKCLQEHHGKLKRFLKNEFPAAWDAWKPIRMEITEKLKKKFGSQFPDVGDD